MVVARYQTRVARLAQRLLGWVGEPEDVVQDVFLTALRKSGRISRTLVVVDVAGDDHGQSMPPAIAGATRCGDGFCFRHATLQLMRRWRRTEMFWRPKLHAGCASLSQRCPAADREVIVLYYLEECPVAEMSQLLGGDA